MKFRFLNKTIEHQRFEYRPMYYDERRERLARKKAEFNEASEEKPDRLRSESFRDNLKEGWSRTQYRQTQRYRSNIRVFLLVALITALGYFIFNGVDEVDTVVTKLW